MYLDSSENDFTFQGMITLVEGLAIISTAVVLMSKICLHLNL